MSLRQVLSSSVSDGNVDDQLRYLYARKSAIDDLIKSLETYWRYDGRAPRKEPGRETAEFIVNVLAS